MKRHVLFILALAAAPLTASNPGTTAANFLKLGIGPRAAAMGEAQVGLADDIYAAYWNPAGLAQMKTPEAGFVHSQFYEDIQSEYAAYAYPHPTWGALAGSLTYLNVGKFDAYDAGGQSTGQVGAHDTAAGLSYAKSLVQNQRMGSHFALGASGKWIQEQLDTVSAHTYAMDAGLHFALGDLFGEAMSGFKGGVALRNMGPAMKFDQESFNLPRTAAAGLSWTGTWKGEVLTVALDGEKPSDDRTALGAGVELSTLRHLLLRGGYTTRGDLGDGIRMGAGLRFKTIQVDYAFAGAGDLGQTHRIGVTLRIGTAPADPVVLAQNHYQLGLKEYRRSHYAEALVEFNKALEIDSAHPEALRLMKETYEKLKASTPQ